MRINISSNTWNGYTAENQEERLFFNETAFLFWCHALWKLGSSNCCIFEMKQATGMETCTKIYSLFIFNLVYIRIRKTSLFWVYNLMTSLWKPSIGYLLLSLKSHSPLRPVRGWGEDTNDISDYLLIIHKKKIAANDKGKNHTNKSRRAKKRKKEKKVFATPHFGPKY